MRSHVGGADIRTDTNENITFPQFQFIRDVSIDIKNKILLSACVFEFSKELRTGSRGMTSFLTKCWEWLVPSK